jgi:carbohydrate-selective porin OprB
MYKNGYVHLNFYGYPDKSPPSGNTAYNCGSQNHVAGGTGTYNDPVTFASAEGKFNENEVVYIPYIEK